MASPSPSSSSPLPPQVNQKSSEDINSTSTAAVVVVVENDDDVDDKNEQQPEQETSATAVVDMTTKTEEESPLSETSKIPAAEAVVERDDDDYINNKNEKQQQKETSVTAAVGVTTTTTTTTEKEEESPSSETSKIPEVEPAAPAEAVMVAATSTPGEDKEEEDKSSPSETSNMPASSEAAAAAAVSSVTTPAVAAIPTTGGDKKEEEKMAAAASKNDDKEEEVKVTAASENDGASASDITGNDGHENLKDSKSDDNKKEKDAEPQPKKAEEESRNGNDNEEDKVTAASRNDGASDITDSNDGHENVKDNKNDEKEQTAQPQPKKEGEEQQQAQKQKSQQQQQQQTQQEEANPTKGNENGKDNEVSNNMNESELEKHLKNLQSSNMTVVQTALTNLSDIVEQDNQQQQQSSSNSTTSSSLIILETNDKKVIISSILDTMKKHQNSAPIQELCCSILWGMAAYDYDDVVRNEIGIIGGIPNIIHSMRYHPKNSAVLSSSCGAIMNLCTGSSKPSSTATATPMKVAAVPNNNNVYESATKTTVANRNRCLVTNADGINVILGVLKKNLHYGTSRVQENGIGALRNISIGSDERKVAIGTRGIPIIISAMHKYRDDAILQEYACGCLNNLCCGIEKNRITINNALGIKAIVNAMKNHNSVVGVQEAGCGCIMNMCDGWEDGSGEEIIPAKEETHKPVGNRTNVASNGGIVPIINSMNTFLFKSERVQEFGLGALNNLCCNNVRNGTSVVNRKGIPAILNSMNQYPNNENIQQIAISALNNLLAGSTSHSDDDGDGGDGDNNNIHINSNTDYVTPILMRNDAHLYITKAMELFPNNEEIQADGTFLLSKCNNSSTKNNTTTTTRNTKRSAAAAAASSSSSSPVVKEEPTLTASAAEVTTTTATNVSTNKRKRWQDKGDKEAEEITAGASNKKAGRTSKKSTPAAKVEETTTTTTEEEEDNMNDDDYYENNKKFKETRHTFKSNILLHKIKEHIGSKVGVYVAESATDDIWLPGKILSAERDKISSAIYVKVKTVDNQIGDVEYTANEFPSSTFRLLEEEPAWSSKGVNNTNSIVYLVGPNNSKIEFYRRFPMTLKKNDLVYAKWGKSGGAWYRGYVESISKQEKHRPQTAEIRFDDGDMKRFYGSKNLGYKEVWLANKNVDKPKIPKRRS